MGMFDTVVARCPECGQELEFQSKAGPCDLKRYKSTSVPPEIACSLSGDTMSCSKCGCLVEITYGGAQSRVSMGVSLVGDEEYD